MAGEMVPWLKVLAILIEDLRSVPNIHTGSSQLPATSSSNTFIWTLRASACTCAHVLTQTLTCINTKNKEVAMAED